MGKHKNTLEFKNGVYILSGSGVVGPKEGEGPLGNAFDKVYDTIQGEKNSWENSEIALQNDAASLVLEKANMTKEQLDYLLGGDLLNQLMVTNATAEVLGTPYFGLYNACATMAESIAIGSLLVDGAFADDVMVIASSHNATSERQYRNPTELGAQRPQTAQWTVTGAGAMILSNRKTSIRVQSGTIGRVQDYGVKDPNEMGAAMAPAVFETMKDHFKNTNTTPEDYDLIISGDLGYHGHKILMALFQGEKLPTGSQFQDSGIWIYDKKQDVHSGGSGAGCSATVWSTYLLEEMRRNKYKKVLLAGSGALLSPTSLQQGNAIPSVCHAISLERQEALNV